MRQLESGFENEGQKDKVTEAIRLLDEDIVSKIEEIEKLQQYSKQKKANSQSRVDTPISRDASSLLDTNTGWSMNLSSTSLDPMLVSAFNAFQNNLFSILKAEHSGNNDGASSIELRLLQELNQLKKDVCIIEQKKWKDYDVKTELLIKENKKLSNQIIKLRERWHSLVESAKQKRNQQQD